MPDIMQCSLQAVSQSSKKSHEHVKQNTSQKEQITDTCTMDKSQTYAKQKKSNKHSVYTIRFHSYEVLKLVTLMFSKNQISQG